MKISDCHKSFVLIVTRKYSHSWSHKAIAHGSETLSTTCCWSEPGTNLFNLLVTRILDTCWGTKLCFGISWISPLDCTVLLYNDIYFCWPQSATNKFDWPWSWSRHLQSTEKYWIPIPQENLPEVGHMERVGRCHPGSTKWPERSDSSWKLFTSERNASWSGTGCTPGCRTAGGWWPGLSTNRAKWEWELQSLF